MRKDIINVVGLVAVAALLRFWNIAALGLTHFDEGSYAMTGRWIATFGREGWAYQSVHAPGLYPTLVGAFFLVFGVHDYVAIAVSGVAGSLTVGLVYLIGKDWFCARVGLMAAIFLAVAEYHLVFSRLALTDATFTLLFWAALGCLYRGVSLGDRRWVVAGGLVAGLCWNTKYHGFFPILLCAVWVCLEAALEARGDLRSAPGHAHLREIAVAFGCAALLYLPWALFVQASVGYGHLLRIHADHTIGQGLFVTPPSTLVFYFHRWLALPLLLFALVGLARAAIDRRASARFLAIIFVFFTASATLYMSFPRLVLPMVPALCLLGAFGLDWVSNAWPRRRNVVSMIGAALVVAGSLAGAGKVLAMRTDAYRQAAESLRDTRLPVVSQMSKNYYFYERRPSLEIRHHRPADLYAALRDSPGVVIAVDPIVERLPEALAWVERARGQRMPERVFPVTMYEPVYYQGFDPTTPIETIPRSIAPFVPGASEIRVYRIEAGK